jgi:hypothetical protein
MSRPSGADLLRRVAISVAMLVVCAAAAPLALASAAGSPTCGMHCCEITRECCCDAGEGEASDTASLRRPDVARACPEGCAQFIGQPSATQKIVAPAVAIISGAHAACLARGASRVAIAMRSVRFAPPRAPPALLT